MNLKTISVVISREYTTRVRKKSFLVTTFVVPVLFALLCCVPALILLFSKDSQKTIAVVDHSGIVMPALKSNSEIQYQDCTAAGVEHLKAVFDEMDYSAILSVSALDENKSVTVNTFSKKPVSVNVLSNIEKTVNDAVQDWRIAQYNISSLKEILNEVKPDISIKSFTIGDEGEDDKVSNSSVYMILSLGLGMIIFMFVTMFSSSVMTSVVEEKQSKVVEVLLSSVDAIDLMFGKIIGVALTALTQFLLWIVLTAAIVSAVFGVVGRDAIMGANPVEAVGAGAVGLGGVEAVPATGDITELQEMMQTLEGVNIPELLGFFLLFFLFGYLLYASMFAAIGSAVENTEDSNSLQIPITVPLMLAYFVAIYSWNAPDSALAVWASMIPFTSPIVMLARIPFGVPSWQVWLSLLILVLTFAGTAWVSAKIYRVGILTSGKKATWKDLWKWARTKVIAVSFLMVFAGTGLQAADPDTYWWRRVRMDGSRTAGVEKLSGTPAREAKMLKKYGKGMASLKKVIASCPDGMRMDGPQSPMSCWAADMLLAEFERLFGQKCDMSVINTGGIRNSMTKGNVLYGDLLSIFPFKNNVVHLTMKGSAILKTLDHMRRNSWQTIGGVKVVADEKGITQVTIAGAPLEMDRVYNVAAIDFILNGGDGFFLERDAESCTVSDETIFDAAFHFISGVTSAGGTLRAKVDNRIIYPGLEYRHSDHVVKDAPAVKSVPKGYSLTILHTNDTHSNLEPIRGGKYDGFGGVVERAAFVDSVRRAEGAGNVLLVDIGDYEQGTPYFTLFDGEPEMKAMDIMGYDAAVIGNHEWDNGIDDLSKRIRKARFRKTLSNYNISDDYLSRTLKPYVVVRRGGHKIGLIGVLADVSSLVSKKYSGSIEYKNPVEVINKYSAVLRDKEKCDLVIVLSHCGFVGEPGDVGDTMMAPQLHGVDIIIGGHTHTNLEEPVWMKDADGKPIMIVTDYKWGIYIGEIKL